MKKHTFCGYCGNKILATQFPHQCVQCNNTTYVNPIPVGVALVPVGKGLLVIQRGLKDGFSQWALPGGFLEYRENWQEGLVREVYEETQIQLDAKAVKLFEVHSTQEETILIFGRLPPINPEMLSDFTRSQEILDLKVIFEPITMAFPLHEKVVQQYFSTI